MALGSIIALLRQTVSNRVCRQISDHNLLAEVSNYVSSFQMTVNYVQLSSTVCLQ